MAEQEFSFIRDIIDNSIEGQKLFEVLNSVLLPQVSADFATAYFNVAGFALVKDNLTKAKDFRLLLSKEPVIREPLTTGGGTTLITNELRGDTEEAMGDKETPAIIKELVSFLERDSVQVRLCSSHFSHGKAYIIQGIPYLGEIAISGSPNFTESGLTANWELNTVQKKASGIQGVRNWFERFWDKSYDFEAQLVELLSEMEVKEIGLTPGAVII